MGSGSSKPENIKIFAGKFYRHLVAGMPVIQDENKNVFYFDTGFNDDFSDTRADSMGALCESQVDKTITLVGTKWLSKSSSVMIDCKNDQTLINLDKSNRDFIPVHVFPNKAMLPYGPIFIIPVLVNGRKALALVDTGSRWSYLYKKLSNSINGVCERTDKVRNKFACGLSAPDSINVTVQDQNITLRRTEMEIGFLGQPATLRSAYASCDGNNEIMDEDADMTIGLDFLRHHRMKIDFVAGTNAYD